jgi:hypothetical protein
MGRTSAAAHAFQLGGRGFGLDSKQLGQEIQGHESACIQRMLADSSYPPLPQGSISQPATYTHKRLMPATALRYHAADHTPLFVTFAEFPNVTLQGLSGCFHREVVWNP